jgi:hypothetical protein
VRKKVKEKKDNKENKEKSLQDDLELIEEYHIETFETDICLEDGSFIEFDIDKIEKEIDG